jgi:hypothetical protein
MRQTAQWKRGGIAVKKRSCDRFSIPGTVLYYKNKPRFFVKNAYSKDYYPVINMSRGGAKFLCNQRLKAGAVLIIKLNIPGVETEPEIITDVKWISKNPEQSYRYQIGIAFNAYGTRKNENPIALLSTFQKLEIQSGTLIA